MRPPKGEEQTVTLEQLLPIAEVAGETHHVAPVVLLALWWVESRWDETAINPQTLATGLGQVIPRDYGRMFSDRPTSKELLDPAVNADWSARILRSYLDRRRGDIRAALKGYSGGWETAGDDAYDRVYWQPFLRKYRELVEEVFLSGMTATKLGAHVQEAYPAAYRHLQEAMYPALKVMGNVSPETVASLVADYCVQGRPTPFVWRREWTDDKRDEWVRQGEVGAVAFYNHTIAAYERWRSVTNVVESVNEFTPWAKSDMRALNDFEARLCELFHREGFCVVVGNFSVGWPRLEHWEWYKDALTLGDYLGLHEYWWPGLPDDGWRALRYRRALEAMRGFPRVPPVLITELGWDRAAAGGGDNIGFRAYDNDHEYLRWLQWYDSELQKDPQVLYAVVFQTGAAGDWRQRGFDVVGSNIEHDLAVYVRGADIPTPAPPAPETGEAYRVETRAYDWQGNEVPLEALQQRYGFEIKRAAVEPGCEVFGLVAVREKHGTAATIIKVTHKSAPDVGRAVAWYWPDAPQENPEPTLFDWMPNYLVAMTNANGEVGPGMGVGAYHNPGEPGPHGAWIISPSTASDAVFGLGMLVGTDHHHVDLEFALVVEPQPAPDVPESHLEAIRKAGWNLAGVDYNPDAAFVKYARLHHLGAPMGQEGRVEVGGKRYAVQPYRDAIVYTEEGEWGLEQIKELDY